MSRKKLAVGAAVIFVFSITVMVFLTISFTALQAINPIAALTAITVAVVGLAWFKKISN